jgi:transcriptional regulator with XRE-family HTH domain
VLDLVEIGRKIRGYRQRAKLSQIDLELEIGASSGSISRTENGKINSDKETLLKIAKVLKMSPIETAGLFGIVINKVDENGFGDHEQLYGQYHNTYENTYDFLQNLDVNKAFEESTKKIEEHGYHNICIYLIDPDTETFKLKKTTVPQSTLELALELLRKDIYEVEFSLTDSTLITQAILTGKIQVSSQMFELIIPHLGELYSLQSSRNTQQVIALPMKIESKVIGCITFQTKDSIVNAEIISELEKLGESVSKTIFTAELKKEFDRNFEKSKIPISEEKELKANLMELFTYSNFLHLWNTELSMRVFCLLTSGLTLYWIFNQIFLPIDVGLYFLWGDIYFSMAIFAAIVGYKAYNFIGGFNTKLGKMLVFLILISLLHSFGQVYNTFVTRMSETGTFPYPSTSDLGFLTATIFSMCLSIYVYKYIRTKCCINPFSKLNILLFILIALIIFSIKYLILLEAYDWSVPGWKTVLFDSAYIIAECLGVMFAIYGLSAIRRTVISKEAVFFLSLFFYSSILLYICDLFFSYQYYQNLFIRAGLVDFLYFVYYTVIAFGHVALHATIKKDIDIQKRESGLKDYKFTVEKVVNKLLD